MPTRCNHLLLTICHSFFQLVLPKELSNGSVSERFFRTLIQYQCTSLVEIHPRYLEINRRNPLFVYKWSEIGVVHKWSESGLLCHNPFATCFETLEQRDLSLNQESSNAPSTRIISAIFTGITLCMVPMQQNPIL